MRTHTNCIVGVSFCSQQASLKAQHGQLGKKCDLLQFIYEKYCIFADSEFIVHREVALLMQRSDTVTYKKTIWSNFMRATKQ